VIQNKSDTLDIPDPSRR